MIQPDGWAFLFWGQRASALFAMIFGIKIRASNTAKNSSFNLISTNKKCSPNSLPSPPNCRLFASNRFPWTRLYHETQGGDQPTLLRAEEGGCLLQACDSYPMLSLFLSCLQVHCYISSNIPDVLSQSRLLRFQDRSSVKLSNKNSCKNFCSKSFWDGTSILNVFDSLYSHPSEIPETHLSWHQLIQFSNWI